MITADLKTRAELVLKMLCISNTPKKMEDVQPLENQYFLALGNASTCGL
jgi:hypothetical protein